MNLAECKACRKAPRADGSELCMDCREARGQFKHTIAKAVGGDDAKAEVLMQRIADRLGGYTHEEAVTRHPMPGDDE